MINYDYINEYIRNTIKKEEGLLLELRNYAEENNIPIIQPEVAKLLTVLGLILRPSKILEIGTAIGYSSILLSRILGPDGTIDTIESDDIMAGLARENVKKAGCKDIINVIEGDAMDVLPYLDKKYDFIFLDAAKGQYVEFFPFCFRLLNVGGVLVSDNVLYKGMVANDELVVRRKKTIVKRLRTYLHDICNNPNLETSILPIGDGVAISYHIGVSRDISVK
ncbi:MAG TPA: O-methyltransferase [Clostridiaceae bacterium]|nr:O-methyltransferase [Clostridiaceae bacterium]